MLIEALTHETFQAMHTGLSWPLRFLCGDFSKFARMQCCRICQVFDRR